MRIFWAFCLILSLIACDKSEADPTDFGFEYYPAHVGDYKTYQVDCLVFNDFTLETDTYQFWYKDLTESKYTDQGGREVFRVERYKSQDQGNWTIHKVWTSIPDNQSVEEQLDNLREVKLTFPVKGNRFWDGNSRNSLDREDFSYVSQKIDTALNGLSFESVQRIEQYDESDPLQILTIKSHEHYAKNVGLIHRYDAYIKKFTTGAPDDPGVDSGYAMTISITDYDVQQ